MDHRIGASLPYRARLFWSSSWFFLLNYVRSSPSQVYMCIAGRSMSPGFCWHQQCLPILVALYVFWRICLLGLTLSILSNPPVLPAAIRASAIIYRTILPARIAPSFIRFLIIFILNIFHHISAFECIPATWCPIISPTVTPWASHLYFRTKSYKCPIPSRPFLSPWTHGRPSPLPNAGGVLSLTNTQSAGCSPPCTSQILSRHPDIVLVLLIS